MITTEEYRHRRTIALVIGLILTLLSIYQFPSIWITKTDLKKINGTLETAHTDISWVFTKKRRNPNQISKSHKSELKFQLKEYNQEYYLTENVGEHFIDEKYERILQGLRNADSVSVWIKQNEESAWRPQIFQIDSDKTTLLNFQHLHLENNLSIAFMFISGIFLILLYTVGWLRDKYKST